MNTDSTPRKMNMKITADTLGNRKVPCSHME